MLEIPIPSTYIRDIDLARIGAYAEKSQRDALIEYRKPLGLSSSAIATLEKNMDSVSDEAIEAYRLKDLLERIGMVLKWAVDDDYFVDTYIQEFRLRFFTDDMKKGAAHAKESGIFFKHRDVEDVKTLAGAEGYFIGSLLFAEASGSVNIRYLNEAIKALRYIRSREFHEKRPDIDFQEAIVNENAAILSEFRRRNLLEICGPLDYKLSFLSIGFNPIIRSYIVGDFAKKAPVDDLL